MIRVWANGDGGRGDFRSQGQVPQSNNNNVNCNELSILSKVTIHYSMGDQWWLEFCLMTAEFQSPACEILWPD